MKKQLYFIRTFILAIVMYLPMQGFAQELKPGDFLPELTSEERTESLRGNLISMHFLVLSYAKMNGQSIEEVGRTFGEMYAKTWPDSATPEFFLTAMNRNWQMFGLRMEVLEVGNDYMKARVDKLQISDKDDAWYKENYGFGFSDVESFLRVLEKDIIAKLGLKISHMEEDKHVVVSVSK